jgi:peptidoglycan/LPS O-acetylase OafA/YrhL
MAPLTACCASPADRPGPGTGPDYLLRVPARQRLGYLPALDGVRAGAVILVILHHADLFGMPGGGLVGVESFFVLSGFLITALLIGERRVSGRVALPSFYARRALRLFPALLAMVVAVSAYSWHFHDERSRDAIPGVLLYFANWSQANGRPLALLSHTWSLAVEEQFYLVWPALLVIVFAKTRNFRAVAIAALALAVTSTVIRLTLWHGDADVLRLRNGFDTRASGLLLGCVLAVFVMGQYAGSGRLAVVGSRAAAAGAVVLLVMSRTTVNERWGYGWGLSVVQLGALALIGGLVVAPAGRLPAALSTAPLRWIGQRAYGLYLWHFPVFRIIARETHLGRARTLALELALTFAIAAFSYRVIEGPALRLKSRFTTQPVPAPV